MALFTAKADSDLPILTRLYQIAPEIGETETEILSSEIAKFLLWWLDREGRSDVVMVQDVTLVAQFLATLRSIMDGLADRRAPSEEALKRLEDYAQGYLGVPRLIFVGDQPSLRYGPGKGEDRSPVHEALARAGLAALFAAIERTTFARCTECDNPYVQTRAGQKWCSQRDRTRSGDRRRYEKKFAEYRKIPRWRTRPPEIR